MAKGRGSAVAVVFPVVIQGQRPRICGSSPHKPQEPAIPQELQIAGAIFTALLGLAFGSFLNVLITRLPEDESVVTPRSHCRNCAHTLNWWENLPVLSWILLKGRCRNCKVSISPQYPLIEVAVALLWTAIWIKFSAGLVTEAYGQRPAQALCNLIGYAIFAWLLAALAVLDAQEFWLPNVLTYPGIALGILFSLTRGWAGSIHFGRHQHFSVLDDLWPRIVEILISAGIILIIRLAYWLVRRKEGMGLGDAKLMAMLGAWLGLIGAIECFTLAILGATIAALIWLFLSIARGQAKDWARMPLPLGTFLCLAALTEIFYPAWFWNWWSKTFLLF